MNRIRKSNAMFPLYVILLIVVAIIVAHVWVDRLYDLRKHVALGYGSVYAANMRFELFTRYIGAGMYMWFTWIAVRPFRTVLPTPIYHAVKWLAGFLGWVIGYGIWSLNPTDWFLFFHHQAFSVSDPIFHLNDAFYVYDLPILVGLVARIIGTLVWILVFRIIFLLVVFAQQHFAMTKADLAKAVRRQARVVLSLAGGLFLCFAAMTVLHRYQLAITSSKGQFIYGPDFVVAKLTIPIFSWIHILLLLAVAVVLFVTCLHIDSALPTRDGIVQITPKSFKRPISVFGLYIGVQILTSIIGALVGALYVHPNENTVELPYIQHTIDATRFAFGIDKVQTQPFTPAATLTTQAVTKDQGTLANARVNDQGQTTTIYNQLQSFKSYFTFSPASVDRYQGSEVYVSARQMDSSKLPVQTWVNKTLVYTHGYGVAISPVNQFDADGLPTMLAKNTPQETQAPIPDVKEPRIYFGLMDGDVIAPSKQAEFDYPVGANDHASHYSGGTGLPIEGNRWLLALEEGSLKFFTSDQLTAQSEWLFDRDIYQRVADIAPFLNYDQDAFPFIDGQGHIQWMLDAYTETNNIPYAQQYMGTTYIRNSVKVVMDAYTGKTVFYVIDPSDPMIQGLMHAYPDLFTTQVPADVAAHFRYPQDLFQAQATALTRYHMTDPSAFYNQEDLWDLAKQIYQQNESAPRPPVYQMVRMPDRAQPQFILSALFTPTRKDNLNGWLVADNEAGHYGQLTVYQFPQASWIVGPMQAENQIDSNPQISSQLTLWNQQGSHVVRGDLLLIPVGDTLIYVEPIYLVANRDNSLPQLERVVVSYNKQVFIDTSLGAAMQDVLQGNNANATQPNAPAPGGGTTPPAPGGTTTPGGTVTAPPAGGTDLVSQANYWFQQYEADTAKGDFEAAGKDLKQLGDILEQMKGNPSQNQTASH